MAKLSKLIFDKLFHDLDINHFVSKRKLNQIFQLTVQIAKCINI